MAVEQARGSFGRVRERVESKNGVGKEKEGWEKREAASLRGSARPELPRQSFIR